MRLAVFLLAMPLLVLAQGIPAFPEAEGFGSRTPGGRGGKALAVTTLADSGPGSLRQAVATPGSRIIVFRVSGVIDLKSPLRVQEPFVTIAGQTAPGDGICLRGRGLIIETHDVVVRFLRSRPGDIAGVELDAISVAGNSRNVILDHCSASWATDEVLSPSGGIADVTVQWCLIAESLNRSVHRKGPHGYGSLARAAGGVSLHHNIWAHHAGRNPRLGDNYGRAPFPTFDVRNNVIYDLGGPSIVGDRLSVNYVNNFVKPGPSSNLRRGLLRPTDKSEGRFYLDGNVVASRPDLAGNPARLFDRIEIDGRKLVELVPRPFEAPAVHTVPAEEAYQIVLAQAGATVPTRDAVDRRIVAGIQNGTGSLIDSQREVGGWPAYRSAPAPVDTDGDGMPDKWERARSLNPRDPADGAALAPGGYTNVEIYLNELAGSHLRRPDGASGRRRHTTR